MPAPPGSFLQMRAIRVMRTCRLQHSSCSSEFSRNTKYTASEDWKDPIKSVRPGKQRHRMDELRVEYYVNPCIFTLSGSNF